MPSASAEVKQDASNACLMMTEATETGRLNMGPKGAGMLANSDGYTLQQSTAVMKYAVNVACPDAKPLVASTLGAMEPRDSRGRLWQRAAIVVSGSCWWHRTTEEHSCVSSIPSRRTQASHNRKTRHPNRVLAGLQPGRDA